MLKEFIQVVATLVLTAVWTTAASVGLFLIFLRHPFKFFRQKERRTPPKCLSDGWIHAYLNLPGRDIKLHYVQTGDSSKPLMLFLHGFPDFWYTWRTLLREFSKDYRAVAIDMRGYGDSDKPPNKAAYDLSYLVGDVVSVIKGLGYSNCVLVAHDWGGLVAWSTTLQHPEVVDKLVIMNCPHPAAFQNFILTDITQLLKSWYIFFFQSPWLPEIAMRSRDLIMFDQICRKSCKNPEAFSDDEVEAYKYTFGKPGAQKPPIDYYRALMQKIHPAPQRTTIERPTLIIWGTGDIAIDARLAPLSRDCCSNGVLKLVEGASHWVQHDEPALCIQYMRQFLGSAR